MNFNPLNFWRNQLIIIQFCFILAVVSATVVFISMFSGFGLV